jgi:ATP-dependent DNA helicase RecG
LILSIRTKTLKKLGLLKGRKLLNAGVVLFCNTDLLEVQMAIFAGKDKLTFLDIKQQKGNIFYLLKETELYIKNVIKWRVQFGKLEREEIPEIPISAVREALVNSFCHRDYNRPESNKISIFKNRIEIYNPGDFPEGLTPADFIKGDEESVLRNPLVAQNLYYSKEIEKFGSGLKRIYDQCRQNNVKVEFGVRKTGFFVTFFRPDWETVPANVPVNVPVNVPDSREGKILSYIIKNSRTTIPELSKILKVNEKTIKRDFDKLKKKRRLIRVGSDKSGFWKILK